MSENIEEPRELDIEDRSQRANGAAPRSLGSQVLAALRLGLDHARWSRDRSRDPIERRLNEQDVLKIEAAIAAAPAATPPLTQSQRADLLRVARYLAANNDQDASIPGAEAERIATVLRNIVREQPASIHALKEARRA